MATKTARGAKAAAPVEVAPPPGADTAPAEDSAAMKLRKTRRVHGLTYDPAHPPPSEDVAVVAQASVTIGEKTYEAGTRLTLPRKEGAKLVDAGQATYG